MRSPLPLDRAQVHVWVASLETGGESIPNAGGVLAPDERQRAGRLRTPELRQRFVAARAFLRQLLAAYAALDASALRFAYGANGKPCLADAPDLRFNLSHAGDAAMYAIASGREVGIDIEATARTVDADGVARHAFSPHECAALAELAPDARRDAFFHVWTRKEAYVKARGQGLSYPTRSFSVSHCDDDALIDDDRDRQARDHWRVTGLAAPPGFAAALAAEGRDWTMLRFDAAQLPR